MSRPRPQLSITLPRNFTFHYDGAKSPRTPEEQTELPSFRPSQAEGPFKVKRRPRPDVTSLRSQCEISSIIPNNDTPLPSIEEPTINRPARPLFSQSVSDTSTGFATVSGLMSLPRTPEPGNRSMGNRWTRRQDSTKPRSRPLSACSVLSNSSDDSDGSLNSSPAGEGSCTSPESDAPDPFRLTRSRKGKSSSRPTLPTSFFESRLPEPQRMMRSKWSPEMDRHLWSTYLLYLQDPMVTPFKMLPGVAPPLGVCHRVSREARKTWRGGFPTPRVPPASSTALRFQPRSQNVPSSPSILLPDNGWVNHSGKGSQMSPPSQALQAWPRSGSNTRRRLRYLCKRKPSIAPHYQRLLQSRSPSPISSSQRSLSRSGSRLTEKSGSPEPSEFSFNTRDIQLSLSTSTADSMQPHGPLAQLANNNRSIGVNESDPLDEPSAPFASELPVPSDLSIGPESDSAYDDADASATPRLGSPCGFHTWGPSQSKQRYRERLNGSGGSSSATVGPSLLSPLVLRENFPYPGINKRRAYHPLEDEVSPGGSSVLQRSFVDPGRTPTGDRHRRVRSRGFSLGDLHEHHPLQSLFLPENLRIASSATLNIPDLTESTDSADLSPINPIRQLDSPFHGISPRPARRAPRHLAAFSLGAYDHVPSSSHPGHTASKREEFHCSHSGYAPTTLTIMSMASTAITVKIVFPFVAKFMHNTNGMVEWIFAPNIEDESGASPRALARLEKAVKSPL